MFSNYLSITGLIGLLLLSCTGREKEMKLGNFRIDGELAGQTIPITDKVLMPLKIFASLLYILIETVTGFTASFCQYQRLIRQHQ